MQSTLCWFDGSQALAGIAAMHCDIVHANHGSAVTHAGLPCGHKSFESGLGIAPIAGQTCLVHVHLGMKLRHKPKFPVTIPFKPSCNIVTAATEFDDSSSSQEITVGACCGEQGCEMSAPFPTTKHNRQKIFFMRVTVHGMGVFEHTPG